MALRPHYAVPQQPRRIGHRVITSRQVGGLFPTPFTGPGIVDASGGVATAGGGWVTAIWVTSSITFTDAATGIIIWTGAAVESYVNPKAFTDAATGTIVFTGSALESRTSSRPAFAYVPSGQYFQAPDFDLLPF